MTTRTAAHIARRRLFVIAAIAALAGPTPGEAGAAVVPDQPCRIAIEVSSTVPLHWSAEQVRRFRAEAADVWTLRGVPLCWRDPQNRCAQAGATLHVRIAEEVPSAAPDGRRTLGWIGFSERTGPGPFVVLSLRRVADLLARAERSARRLGELPGMVERLLPRALGRALAHELGHFLLGRRAHSDRGVMREAFRPEDLADDRPGGRFRLARGDEEALRDRCRPLPRGEWGE
jgi:hypothetical protein